MLEFVLNTIFWTLAIYGLFEIIKNIIYICTYTHLNSNGMYFIIAVKNQEDKIECFLRNLIFRIVYGKEEINNILVVDLNSKDNTKKIVENLSKEYGQINLLSWKECNEVIENIEDI